MAFKDQFTLGYMQSFYSMVMKRKYASAKRQESGTKCVLRGNKT